MKPFRRHQLTGFAKIIIFLLLSSPLGVYMTKHKKALVNICLVAKQYVTTDTEVEPLTALPPLETQHLQKVRIRTHSGVALNLREAPRLDAPIVTKIPHHSVAHLIGYGEHLVTIEGEKGRWCEISYAGTYRGYAFGAYLIVLDP